ncbi:uncharacterized protein [Lepeophtheirus salmonis]|uniref:Serine/threonineprotein phosphatase 4 regulatory subunit 2like [Ceratitis capitata] n=3 Tax=Lepeophtheirus salmonis TaxID=72036 RepID=A0A0K2TYA8_LEPSM|nr:serine/threonine-protein phosphatase 4 regulatory subunit 2-like [Lepeophtheirus salmonis]
MSANGMLENIEEVLMELTSFEKKFGKDDGAEIPQILDDYLIFVARTGNTHFPWMKIKPLFRSKLEKVIREFSQKSDEVPLTPNVDPFQFDVVKDTVFEQLEFFAGIPFTVQRLCELLTSPSKHYKRTDKFMRALEKNMLVVSTVEAVHPSASAVSNSSSIVSVTNGGNSATESFSSTLEQREREAHLVNGSTTTSPSPSMSSDDDEKEGLKSDETEVYSPPQSNGNSQPDEQQIINGSSTDLETSGPCDSGESSSSSENSSPNPHVVPESSSSSSDSTTNEAAVSSLKMEDLHDDESLHLKDELADELLPLTDSMEIDSECSSSENLLIEASSGIRRRQEEIINDEVQSTDEDESTSALSTSSPCKKLKTCMDEEARRLDSLNEAVTREEGEVGEESDSPTSSKDDLVMQTDVDKSDTTISSMDSCCGSTDDDANSRVSTSQDTTNDQQQPEMKDSSSPPSLGTNEATPSTSSSSVVSPVESSQNTENIDINNANDTKEEEEDKEEDESNEKNDSVLNNDGVDTEVEQSS